jgi:hypothetical protein
MSRWLRSLLKVLLTLALLWQSVMAPMAAAAGCCEGDQPCCVALRAGAACATCLPVLAEPAVASVPAPVVVDEAPAWRLPPAWLSRDQHEIWRPPMAAVATHPVF